MNENIQSRALKFSWRWQFSVTIARYVVICTAKNVCTLDISLKNSYNAPYSACVHYNTTAWPVKYDVASTFHLPFILVPFVPLSPSLFFLFLPRTVICRPTLTPLLQRKKVVWFLSVSQRRRYNRALGPSVPTGIHIISANI